MQVTSHSLLEMTPVIPVVQITDAEQAVPIAQALRKGGIAMLEIVMRTPVSLEAIKQIRAEVPDVIVGAGTVTDVAKLEAAVDAGCEFVITPGLTRTMAEAGQGLSMPMVPGCPAPATLCWDLSMASRVQVLSGRVSGGIAALKALAAPFSSDFLSYRRRWATTSSTICHLIAFPA